jgi:hypothetical protein
MSRGMATLLVLGACAALPATARGAETWLQPEPLSKAGTFNDAARLATNSPGTAAVIWTEFANGRTPRNRIRVSTRAPDAKWEPSQQLSGAGEGGVGAVGVDPQNRITAVWDEAGTVMFADKAPGHPWSAADAIPDGAGQKPDLFVASDGTATAIWQKGTLADTLVIRTARRPLGGTWSAVETISPAWSYRPHIEGDTAGDVTVSYTHETPSERYIYAVDRPNSGLWGTQTPVAGPAITDNISDLVVAPNSGRASVFWQNGSIGAPLAARTRAAGTEWSAGTTQEISGGTAGRLDLSELDRAAVDGTGLVTATWLAGNKVLTAYRSESAGGWTAPTPPAEIEPGDGTTQLGVLQIASNAFGRAVTTWTASGAANRWSLRGPGGGTPWSAPKAIDGVPADAAGLDLAVDSTGRVSYVWLAEDADDENIASLAISTYGNPSSNPQPPAPHGPAPATGSPGGGSGGGGSGGGPPAAAKAKLQGKPTTRRGVAFVLTMPAAGTARIVIARAAPSKRKYRRVGVVNVRLEQGRNVVRVRKVKKRKLTRAKYRATITPKVGKRTLKPIRLAFRIRR